MGYQKFNTKGFEIAKWDDGDEWDFYINQEVAGDCYSRLSSSEIKELIKFLKKNLLVNK